MLQLRLAGLVPSLGLVALVAGCVGPSASISSDASGPVNAALAPVRDFTGTWRGSFSQISASLYEDEADCTLQIKEDGAFTATIKRSAIGTNNLAKGVTWSGTVVRRGNQIILRSSQEQWLTFIRTGDTLYGVAEDPLVEAIVTLTLKRDGSSS
jgi:hypothetical protein